MQGLPCLSKAPAAGAQMLAGVGGGVPLWPHVLIPSVNLCGVLPKRPQILPLPSLNSRETVTLLGSSPGQPAAQ